MLTMNPEVQDLLTSGVTLTDAALERLLPSATTEPHSIHRAMRHSTFAGGKRLRPILCMEAARMVAGQIPPAQPGFLQAQPTAAPPSKWPLPRAPSIPMERLI